MQQVSRPDAPWLVAQAQQGPDAVAAVHQQVLQGRSDPRLGHVLAL